MKAEHRKELQTNWLADHLGRWLQGLSQGPSINATVFWGIVVVAVGLMIGWWYYSAAQAQSRAALWAKLDAATSLDALETIAKENPNTMPARIAQFQKARTLLRDGLEKLAAAATKERDEARSKVEEAAGLYATLAKDNGLTPPLKQEALLGAARGYESYGEIDKALDYYQELAKNYANTPFGEQAAATFEKLSKNKEEVKQFYQDFTKMTVKAEK